MERIVLLLVTLTACASYQIVDWKELAISDGMVGENRIEEYLIKYNMSGDDQEIYLKNFRESLLKSYCTFTRGKNKGLDRDSYDHKCPLNSNFKIGYELGVDSWFAKRCTLAQGKKDGMLNKYPLDCPTKYLTSYLKAYFHGKEIYRKESVKNMNNKYAYFN